MNPHNAHSRTRRLSNAIGFLVPVCLSIGIYLLFNWARFGSMFDTGYSYLTLVEGFLDLRIKRFGIFHPAYLLSNFIYMFLQGPHIEFGGELKLIPQGMDIFGTSLIFASPFVLFALFAKGNKVTIYSAWTAIGFTLLHMLLYYGNGYVQINVQRYTLDFLPVLILLVASSLQNIDRKLLCTLITYSVLLNIIALFLLPAELNFSF
jgi:hypothetical protein